MPMWPLQPAVASGVLPQSLSTSFAESHVYPLLSISYNDGTFERSLIVDGANAPRRLRTWTLAKRLTTVQLSALLNFFENIAQGGLNPFFFYDPLDVLSGQHVGSNYDATGDSTQGRVVVFFRGSWSQKTELGRHVVPNLTLVECWDAQQTGGGRARG
jgi:hypothetical protein